MARITVEDCLHNVENRFELVMVASKRARQIQTGGRDPMVPEDNDKPTVLALREIAQNLVDAAILLDTPEEELAQSAANIGIQTEESPKAAQQDISIEAAMDAELVPEEGEPEANPADIDANEDDEQ